MNCAQLNQIPLTEILNSLNYQSIKRNTKEEWYLSPFRKETKPSFKVQLAGNVWFDHGMGKGGRVVDFLCEYFECSVKEALLWARDKNFNFSFQKQVFKENEIESCPILNVKPLRNNLLLNYLNSRGISTSIARQYSKEVIFRLNNKNQFAIGFENKLGGYELRNKYLKFCLGKKDISFITNQSNTCLVFEGFVDFLSWMELIKSNNQRQDYLILNSVSMINRATKFLKDYNEIKLLLDNDSTGKKNTQRLLKLLPQSEDFSNFYSSHKDVNEYLNQSFSIENNKGKSELKTRRLNR